MCILYEDNVRRFFSAYALSDLKYLFTELNISNYARESKIQALFEEVVDSLYEDIKKDLTTSLLDEFDQDCINDDSDFYQYRKKSCVNARYDYYYDFIISTKKSYPHNFTIIGDLFSARYSKSIPLWKTFYGGIKWAKAAYCLSENPKNSQEKMYWVDKILDMYHNTGHILNKGAFACLSKNVICVKIKGKRKKYITPLNVRAKGDLIGWANLNSDLLQPKIKNIVCNMKPKLLKYFADLVPERISENDVDKAFENCDYTLT